MKKRKMTPAETYALAVMAAYILESETHSIFDLSKFFGMPYPTVRDYLSFIRFFRFLNKQFPGVLAGWRKGDSRYTYKYLRSLYLHSRPPKKTVKKAKKGSS